MAGVQGIKPQAAESKSTVLSLHHTPSNKKWSWPRDLNPQPADYKSAALPVELDQLGRVYGI